MAHTRNWDESVPGGGEAASDIDKIIRELKVDIRERLASISDFSNDKDPINLKANLAFAVKRDSVQSIPDNTWTTVDWESEVIDRGNIIDLTSNNSRAVIPTDGNGLYLVIGCASFEANGTGSRGIRFLLNGSGGGRLSAIQINAGASLQTQVGTVGIISLADGDYVEMEAFQDSGGALDLNFGENTVFQGFRIGQ